MERFPPRLFLIGAQKAGTTSLAFLLDQHPDIAVSNPKEPGYFNANYDRGMAWYRSCFPADLPALLVDASTGYTMAPADASGSGEPHLAADRIKELSPDARFIYVLRDPVDRTISSIQHDQRAGRLGKSPVREIVSANPFYTDVSRYFRQIAPYLERFPRDRFLFIDFRDLSSDPVATFRRCVAFAGLDPSKAAPELGTPKNSAFQFNRIGRGIFRLLPGDNIADRAIRGVKRVTPPIVHRAVKSALTQPPEAVSEDDRRWISQLFKADNAEMEALAGFRFYR